jgi:hypothetical protein
MTTLPGWSYPLEMVPPWCDMPKSRMGHGDGMGGCWGIASGLQALDGERYCLRCEFYLVPEKRLAPDKPAG